MAALRDIYANLRYTAPFAVTGYLDVELDATPTQRALDASTRSPPPQARAQQPEKRCTKALPALSITTDEPNASVSAVSRSGFNGFFTSQPS